MKKWLVSILGVVVSVASFLLPSIQAYIAQHPLVAAEAGSLAVILAHLAKSPLSAE